MLRNFFNKTDAHVTPIRELTESEAGQVSGGGARTFFKYNHFHNATAGAAGPEDHIGDFNWKVTVDSIPI